MRKNDMDIAPIHAINALAFLASSAVAFMVASGKFDLVATRDIIENCVAKLDADGQHEAAEFLTINFDDVLTGKIEEHIKALQ